MQHKLACQELTLLSPYVQLPDSHRISYCWQMSVWTLIWIISFDLSHINALSDIFHSFAHTLLFINLKSLSQNYSAHSCVSLYCNQYIAPTMDTDQIPKLCVLSLVSDQETELQIPIVQHIVLLISQSWDKLSYLPNGNPKFLLNIFTVGKKHLFSHLHFFHSYRIIVM